MSAELPDCSGHTLFGVTQISSPAVFDMAAGLAAEHTRLTFQKLVVQAAIDGEPVETSEIRFRTIEKLIGPRGTFVTEIDSLLDACYQGPTTEIQQLMDDTGLTTALEASRQTFLRCGETKWENTTTHDEKNRTIELVSNDLNTSFGALTTALNGWHSRMMDKNVRSTVARNVHDVNFVASDLWSDVESFWASECGKTLFKTEQFHQRTTQHFAETGYILITCFTAGLLLATQQLASCLQWFVTGDEEAHVLAKTCLDRIAEGETPDTIDYEGGDSWLTTLILEYPEMFHVKRLVELLYQKSGFVAMTGAEADDDTLLPTLLCAEELFQDKTLSPLALMRIFRGSDPDSAIRICAALTGNKTRAKWSKTSGKLEKFILEDRSVLEASILEICPAFVATPTNPKPARGLKSNEEFSSLTRGVEAILCASLIGANGAMAWLSRQSTTDSFQIAVYENPTHNTTHVPFKKGAHRATIFSFQWEETMGIWSCDLNNITPSGVSEILTTLHELALMAGEDSQDGLLAGDAFVTTTTTTTHNNSSDSEQEESDTFEVRGVIQLTEGQKVVPVFRGEPRRVSDNVSVCGHLAWLFSAGLCGGDDAKKNAKVVVTVSET